MNYNKMKKRDNKYGLVFLVAFFGIMLIIYLVSPPDKIDVFMVSYLFVVCLFVVPIYFYIMEKLNQGDATFEVDVENVNKVSNNIRKYIVEENFRKSDEFNNASIEMYGNKIVNSFAIVNKIIIIDNKNKELSNEQISVIMNKLSKKFINAQKSKKKETYYHIYTIVLTEEFTSESQNVLDKNVLIYPLFGNDVFPSEYRMSYFIPLTLSYKDKKVYFGKYLSYPIIYEKIKDKFIVEVLNIESSI